MVSSIFFASRSSQGVVMMRARSLFSRSRATAFSMRSSLAVWVRLRMMVSALWIWSRKNSRKFFR